MYIIIKVHIVIQFFVIQHIVSDILTNFIAKVAKK